MIKVDTVVAKETTYVAAWTAVLSLLMQAVFIFLQKWDYTVLLGNLWGGAISVLNFFVMGLFIQKAVLQTEQEARKTIKLSYTLRTGLLFVFVVIGVVLPFFATAPLLISLFFSRIAIFLKIFQKNTEKEAVESNE